MSKIDAFHLRNYLASSDYQDRAKRLCKKYGLDYEQARKEVQQ